MSVHSDIHLVVSVSSAESRSPETIGCSDTRQSACGD
jgi:hypothetical protein